LTILRKRDAFRAAFAGFEPDAIARFGADDVERLLGDAGIVRNRAKIDATIANARATVDLRDAGTPLHEIVWAHRPPARPAPRASPTSRPRRRRPPRSPRRSRRPAFASSDRPRSTPGCRPAGWSTTTSRRARCANASKRFSRPSPVDLRRRISLQIGTFFA
jgi:hypothetical protein